MRASKCAIQVLSTGIVLPQNKSGNNEATPSSTSTSHRARVILDISGLDLSDQPALLEDKLRKIGGIISVEINVYSERMKVEFDTSLINIDQIKAVAKRR